MRHEPYRHIPAKIPFSRYGGYRYFFNGQEADNEVYGKGAVLGYEFRQYDARIGRWWSVDPLADKYPGVGPYVFCADSPMMLVDPSGDTIVIRGKNGTQYKYTPGEKCPTGVDYSASQLWNQFNNLNENKAGIIVVSALHMDKTTYYVSNESLKGDNTGRFQEKSNTLYMGGHYANIGDIAHELFHAYQKMMGQGGESIHNEVEAYIFQAIVEGNSFPLSQRSGMNGKDSQYNSAVINLFCNKDHDSFDTYFDAIAKGFKKNAIVNINGLYNGINDRLSNQTDNLVKQFFNDD